MKKLGLRYLVNVLEVGFHALDGNVLVGLDGLGFEDLGKCAFALLANQSVLYTNTVNQPTTKVSN